MPINIEKYHEVLNELNACNATLVAVSKTKLVEDIQALYDLGQRDFGENYVQELTEKATQLPEDIRWHFIGHLQRNKVKYIAPFVYMIHGIDSESLLQEVDKQAAKNNRPISCLLQMHIAREETKFGLDEEELESLVNKIQEKHFGHLQVCGLMGMATFTDDTQKVSEEFSLLHSLFNKYTTALSGFKILSMGMSADYKLALSKGSNMVRIGSLLFGSRNNH